MAWRTESKRAAAESAAAERTARQAAAKRAAVQQAAAVRAAGRRAEDGLRMAAEGAVDKRPSLAARFAFGGRTLEARAVFASWQD